MVIVKTGRAVGLIEQTPEQKLAALKENYVFSDNTINALAVAMRTNKNVLLWGPGGHAKSDLAEAVAKIYYSESKIFVGQMGAGATLNRLLGYVNVANMINGDGTQQYNHEASFMNREVALFDELLDTPTPILEYLKDIMTRGAFCANGTECYKSKTKVMVACTNRDPREWADEGKEEERNSKRAFLGRFPLIVEVAWPSYGQMEYEKLLRAIFKPKKHEEAKLTLIATVLAKSYRKGIHKSPRDARHIAELYLAEGAKGIQYCGLPQEIIDSELANEAQVEKDYAILDSLKPVEKMLSDVEQIVKTCTDFVKLAQLRLDLSEVNDRLGNVRAGEHAVQVLGGLRNKARTLMMNCEQKSEKVLQRTPKTLFQQYNVSL